LLLWQDGSQDYNPRQAEHQSSTTTTWPVSYTNCKLKYIGLKSPFTETVQNNNDVKK